MGRCDITPNNIGQAVNNFYQFFADKNLMAEYSSRRGLKKLPYAFTFIASSPNSFALGKDYYFPISLAKEINGHNIKAVQVASAAEMAKLQTPGLAAVDNVIGSVTGLITFRNECNDLLAQFPFSDAVQNQNGGKFLFTDIPAKIENSSFTFLGGTATDGANGVYFIFYI
jgi:hypothetical protein